MQLYVFSWTETKGNAPYLVLTKEGQERAREIGAQHLHGSNITNLCVPYGFCAIEMGIHLIEGADDCTLKNSLYHDINGANVKDWEDCLKRCGASVAQITHHDAVFMKRVRQEIQTAFNRIIGTTPQNGATLVICHPGALATILFTLMNGEDPTTAVAPFKPGEGAVLRVGERNTVTIEEEIRNPPA